MEHIENLNGISVPVALDARQPQPKIEITDDLIRELRERIIQQEIEELSPSPSHEEVARDYQRRHQHVRPYRMVLNDSGQEAYVNRIMVGTAATGMVRVEWYQARVGMVTPANWGRVDMMQFYGGGYIALRYPVDDAQNLIVREAINKDFEYLLLYEHDVCPPADALLRINQYISQEKVPVVSGLYYTRGRPSEPLIYRGRGTGSCYDWQFGDKVWCDGVPTGFLLIHMSILRAMWDESEEYMVGDQVTRRVFNTPRHLWTDPQSMDHNVMVGTSDLEWCTRVMKGDFFRKAGWDEYADKPYPFLVDTNIFCRHYDINGTCYP